MRVCAHTGHIPLTFFSVHIGSGTARGLFIITFHSAPLEFLSQYPPVGAVGSSSASHGRLNTAAMSTHNHKTTVKPHHETWISPVSLHQQNLRGVKTNVQPVIRSACLLIPPGVYSDFIAALRPEIMFSWKSSSCFCFGQ